MEDLRQTTKNHSQISRSQCQDSNGGPSEYEVGVRTTLTLLCCLFTQNHKSYTQCQCVNTVTKLIKIKMEWYTTLEYNFTITFWALVSIYCRYMGLFMGAELMNTTDIVFHCDNA
jgi:hypothetical protein